MAPFWAQHPWFPDLLELLVEIPFFLPRRRDLLKQPHFHYYHQNLPMLELIAYRLSGEDMFLLYLPEFRAKTESSSSRLPQSFCVRSLWDFVGDHAEELLLCPVRALRVYVSHTSSLSPRPHSLFVSPRAPSHPLSKNALSFFLREVISQASSSSSFSSSSSSGPSAPSPSPSSSCLSCPAASSFRPHSVRWVSASVAFAHNAPLSSVLAAATWSSFTVFTSLYLKDVQFSSPLGFSLGPVVAAGAVV